MPPRFVYWTILIDGKPTAFRARDREELLPTINQLKRTNSDVVVKWFARGTLWESPEAERAAQERPAPVEKRSRDWRPGGNHKDPRDRFKKKNRPERAWSPDERDRDRDPEKAWRPKPAGERRPPRRDGDRKPWANKPGAWKPKPSGSPRGGGGPARHSPEGGGGWRPKPPRDRPWQTKPTGPRAHRKPWNPNMAAPASGDRKPWKPRPPGGPPAQQSPRDPRRGGGGPSRPNRPPSGKKRDDDPDKS